MADRTFHVNVFLPPSGLKGSNFSRIVDICISNGLEDVASQKMALFIVRCVILKPNIMAVVFTIWCVQLSRVSNTTDCISYEWMSVAPW
jgi:hypothetical protein